MKISTVKYLENGYFEVKYNGFDPIIQDIGAMKMQTPADHHIKDVLLFLRRIKLEKISEKDDFDELKYRNFEVVKNEQMERMKQMVQTQSRPTPQLPALDLDDAINML